MNTELVRRGVAELVGTGLLVGAAVGGGKAAAATGAPAYMALVIGTFAAAATLVAVLHAIGPLTGGHVNPAVSISMFAMGKIPALDAGTYILAQFVGGLIGALTANAIWQNTLIAGPGTGTLSGASFAAELIATCGLVGAIHASARGGNGDRLPIVVPAAVVAASFAAPFGMANPAVALGAGLIGGGLSVTSLSLLIAIELAFAVVVAAGVRSVYAGQDASEEAETRAFDVQFGGDLDAATTTLATQAVRAALRPEDSVMEAATGCRVVVRGVNGDDVEDMRHRIEATLQLSLASQVLESGGIEVTPVSLMANT